MIVVQEALADVSGHTFLFTEWLPTVARRVSVVVPVRNEADGITRTLHSLRKQVSATGHPLRPDTYEVLVLVNNCSDDSLAQVRTYQQQHSDFRLCVANITLPPQQAHIGTVRRLLMDEACRRIQAGGHPQGVIASTDGDTEVAPDWLWQILRELDAGNDAVGGRILTYPQPGPARLPHLRDTMYRHLLAEAETTLDPCPNDAWPRHFQHFGASLALTCEAYVRAGRLPVVRYLEDDALVRALYRMDARVRRSRAVRVYTSARLQGRVEVGLSWQLQQWANQQEAGGGQLVEEPSLTLTRYRLRHQLRLVWHQRHAPGLLLRLAPLARELGVATAWLQAQMAECRYFGQLWERTETEYRAAQQNADPPITVPVTEAIAWLRTWRNSR